MDDVKILMLEKAKEKLLDDLQVPVILEQLVAQGILDVNQREELQQMVRHCPTTQTLKNLSIYFDLNISLIFADY